VPRGGVPWVQRTFQWVDGLAGPPDCLFGRRDLLQRRCNGIALKRATVVRDVSYVEAVAALLEDPSYPESLFHPSLVDAVERHRAEGAAR
jgi:hypothetical protein